VLLAIPFGLAIGLIVGGVGGGGAILALPVLVYVLDEPVGPASTASLIVIAIAAAVGAGNLARQGHVCWRLAAAFGPPAAVGSIAGALANKSVSPQALILAFVPVMLIAASATWQRSGSEQPEGEASCPGVPLGPVAISGFAVGALTGFFGVGGGFMVVPVFTLWIGMGFHRAVATSLVVITTTGLVAFASHVAAGAEVDVPVTVLLAGATAVGALAGTLVATSLPQMLLARGFALIVATLSAFLFVDVVWLGGPPGA
jgi:uncharacterized protein